VRSEGLQVVGLGKKVGALVDLLPRSSISTRRFDGSGRCRRHEGAEKQRPLSAGGSVVDLRVLGVLLIFLVLAAQFNSFGEPLDEAAFGGSSARALRS
jgi:hypothetical protein